jgi:hypothetical protein
MAKTYWVKKHPENATDWVEMDGKQFYEFINSPEGKGRYFMDCDTYEIEVTGEQYRQWKKEVNHRDYLEQFEDETEVFSLDTIIEDCAAYGEISDEILIDSSANTEDEALHNLDMELLADALQSLTDD